MIRRYYCRYCNSGRYCTV